MPHMASDIRSTERVMIPARALLPFLVMTFALAWGIFGAFMLFGDRLAEMLGEPSARHPLFILAVYSPAIAAVILVIFHSGVSGLKRYFSRLLLWRCPLGWYGLLLVGIPLIYLGGALLKGNLTAEPLPFPGVGPMLAAMAFMLVLGPVEELGWRGLALPLLQSGAVLVRSSSGDHLGRLAPAGLLLERDAAKRLGIYALSHRGCRREHHIDGALQRLGRQHPAGGAFPLSAQQPPLA